MNYKGFIDLIHECKNCHIKFKDRGHGNRGTYCSRKCNAQFRSNQAYYLNKKRFDNGLINDSSEDRKIVYNIFVKEDKNFCNYCGLKEWNNKPIRLNVDHIDGNSSNNWPNNFQLICPNCDSQSEFYKNRNQGRGRINRRKNAS